MWILGSIRTLPQKLSPGKMLQKFTAGLEHRSLSEVQFKTKPYALHLLDSGPAEGGVLTKAEALKYYEEMVVVRKMEAAFSTLYKSKIIRGFCHLYSGQEAVAVGTEAVFQPTDAIITTYRCHALAYFHNDYNLEVVFGELVGHRNGCSKGKGGSMHMYGKQFYGGQAIVGAQVPLGAGIGFALKYKNVPGVCITFYGDGSANQGQVSEAFNMCALWNIPCVFLCENNLYGMGTSTKRASKMDIFYKQSTYIPGLMVDGMDVLSVREAVRFARNYCLSGKGPIIVEAKTYRYFGHSLSDPGTSYRTREEISNVRKERDPITLFKDFILGANLVSEDELKKLDAKAKNAIDEAQKKALASKPVGSEELTYDIYADEKIKEVRHLHPFAKRMHKITNKPWNLN